MVRNGSSADIRTFSMKCKAVCCCNALVIEVKNIIEVARISLRSLTFSVLVSSVRQGLTSQDLCTDKLFFNCRAVKHWNG